MLPAPQRSALDVALLRASPGRRGANRRALATGLLTLLRQLAAGQAVTIGIDDAQWLDRASRDTITFVARRLSSERVRLICAYQHGPTAFHRTRRSSSELERISRTPRASVSSNLDRSRSPRSAVSSLTQLARPYRGQSSTRSIARVEEIRSMRSKSPACSIETWLIWEHVPGGESSEPRARPAPGEPLPIPGDLQTLTQLDGSADFLHQLATRCCEPRYEAPRRPTPSPLRFSRRPKRQGLSTSAGKVGSSSPTPRRRSGALLGGAPNRLRQFHREAAATAADPERSEHGTLRSGAGEVAPTRRSRQSSRQLRPSLGRGGPPNRPPSSWNWHSSSLPSGRRRKPRSRAFQFLHLAITSTPAT